MTPSIVVFDIGNVLVEWKPNLIWADDFATTQDIEAFLARVDFPSRNLRCDQGETFGQVAAELSDPTDQQLLVKYLDRFHLCVQDEIPGTWGLVDRLIANNVPLHAITNWSAETWPTGVRTHPRLGEIFGVTVVSGEEKLLKPDPKIFALLCERADVAPKDCVFIDDSPKNVAGAKAAGWDAIHFTDAKALETALADRGLL